MSRPRLPLVPDRYRWAYEQGRATALARKAELEARPDPLAEVRDAQKEREQARKHERARRLARGEDPHVADGVKFANPAAQRAYDIARGQYNGGNVVTVDFGRSTSDRRAG